MSEEKNMKLEKTDCFEQRLKQVFSEELSDIQVSEELIQRTLQAAQKASLLEMSKKMDKKAMQKNGREAAGKNRIQKQKRRIHLFQGCAVAAALLVVLGLGFRSIRFSIKNDSAEGVNPPVYDSNSYGGNGSYSGSESSYKGEPGNSGSAEGASGYEWAEDSVVLPQEAPASYPGGWADGSLSNAAALLEDEGYGNNETDGGWDFEYGPGAASPTDIIISNPELEGIDRELLISRAVEILLSEKGEIAGIVPLDGFTDAKEAKDIGAADGDQCAYREFYYVEDEEIEIIGRVYPDGRLEGKLTRHGQVTYKAVASQSEMERLWGILDAQTTNGGME